MIEIFGALSGLLFLYFEYRENAWLWPIGIVSAAFYIFVFFEAKFYADMLLQVYFLVVSIYGWYYWLRGSKSSKNEVVPLRMASLVEMFLFSGISIVLTGVMYFILKHFTDSPVPLGDAFVTALSIVATWMLTHKYVGQWYFWIIVNTVSVGLFVYKNLYPTALFYSVLTIISVAGLYKWTINYRNQQKAVE